MKLLNILLWGVVCGISTLCSGLLMASIRLGLRYDMNVNQRSHLTNIFWMAFSDFARSVNGLLIFFYPHWKTGSAACTMRGAIDHFFLTSSQGWYFIISLTIFLSIKKWTMYKYMTKPIILHIFVWSISLIIAGVPFLNYVQLSNGLCGYIRKSNEMMLFWSFVSIVPTILSVLLSLVVLVLIFRLPMMEDGSYVQKTMLSRTIVFVFAFLITWLPSAVMFIISQFIVPPLIYEYISDMAAYSNGTCNFFVWFFFFPDIQSSLLHTWRIRQITNESLSHSLTFGKKRLLIEESLYTTTTINQSEDLSSIFSLTDR